MLPVSIGIPPSILPTSKYGRKKMLNMPLGTYTVVIWLTLQADQEKP